MIYSTFKKELKNKKLRIISLLLALYIGISLLNLIAYIVRFFIDDTFNREINLLINLIIVLILFYLRFRLLYSNYKLTFYIIILVIFIAAIFPVLIAGINLPIPYILMSIAIVSTSIVINVKTSIILTLIAISVISMIGILQIEGGLEYTPDSTESNIFAIAIINLFVLVIANITRIGYDQIEYSFLKASNYARELETLNKELDQKVKTRTKQLEQSFNKEVDSLHKTAVMGGIARPMVHDLSTPISSLVGAIDLLNKTEDINDKDKFLDHINKSSKQIQRIITGAQKLMYGEEELTLFSPYSITNEAIVILRSQELKQKIKITNKIDPEISLKGVSTLFERFVLNLMLNSIDALANVEREQKYIEVYSQYKRSNIEIIVKDNGTGIEKEDLTKIFELDYTDKSADGHLGLGLNFISKTIRENFNGSIAAQSEKGKFTKFIMTFPDGTKN